MATKIDGHERQIAFCMILAEDPVTRELACIQCLLLLVEGATLNERICTYPAPASDPRLSSLWYGTKKSSHWLGGVEKPCEPLHVMF